MAILLANGMVYEALQFQRGRSVHGGGASSSSMLSYYFERADALGKLDSVMQLCLTPVRILRGFFWTISTLK